MTAHGISAMLSSNHVTVEELTDPSRLALEWQDLFQRADASFFLSWHWISNWLRLHPPGVKFAKVTVRREGQIVGLAVLSRQKLRRYRLLASNLLALHEYAVSDRDLVIEHNGLLVDARWAAEIWTDVVRYLKECVPEWDEIQLSGIPVDCPVIKPDFLQRLCLNCYRSGESDAWYVDLDKVRSTGKGYLATLSKKTRYKLRGYFRDYEHLGPLRVETAGSLGEAQAYFDELKRMHQAYWTRRGKPGSFANPLWERFHRAVIESAFNAGGVQMLRMTAGECTVGYLYNLVHRGHVSMIQSGYNYEETEVAEHAHPGFVSVCLAVEHNVKVGNRVFDFLAGDAQYKRMLAHDRVRLAWVRLQRPRLKFWVEDVGRWVVRKILGRSDDVGF